MTSQGVLGFVPRRAVAWVAGEALLPDGDSDAAAAAVQDLAGLVEKGWDLVVVPGGGAQREPALQRADRGEPEAPPALLSDVLSGAQGAVAQRLRRLLASEAARRGADRRVAVLPLDVEADPDDPPFRTPSRLAGPPVGAARAARLAARGEELREVAPGTGSFRRVVREARPLRLGGLEALRLLLASGEAVVAGGVGSGAAVRLADGTLETAEAIADDLGAAALLAAELKADLFVLLLASAPDEAGAAGAAGRTSSPKGWWGRTLGPREAARVLGGGRRHRDEGHPGLRALDAAHRCLESSGVPAVLAVAGGLGAALDGASGCRLVPEAPREAARAKGTRAGGSAGLALVGGFLGLASLLVPLGGCGGRTGGPSAAVGGSSTAFVSVDRVVARSGPGDGFAAAGTLRRGEALTAGPSERGFVKVRRGAGPASGPEIWLPLGTIETEAARKWREERAAEVRGLAGVPAAAGPAGATVLLAPDWGAPRWGSLPDGEELQVLFAAHDFFAVRLPQLPLAYVPAREIVLRGIPAAADPGSAGARAGGTAPGSAGSAGAGGAGGAASGGQGSPGLLAFPPEKKEGPASIPAQGFEPDAQRAGPLETLPAGAEAPVLRSRVEPRYPDAARRVGISGEVVLRVVVEVDGTAGRVQILSGAPMGLPEAAEDAVRKWTWSPARIGGRAVAVWKTIRVRFAAPGSPGAAAALEAGDRPL